MKGINLYIMGRRKQSGRISLNQDWLSMPLFHFAGFDYLSKTIGLGAHAHDVFEITYVSEGEATWVVSDGSEIRLQGGMAAVTQPGELHQGKFKIISPCRLFWVGFDPFNKNACRDTVFRPDEMRLIGKILKDAGNVSWKADKALAECFEELLTAVRQANKTDALSMLSNRILVCRLLVAIVHSLQENAQAAGKSAFMAAVENYINKNLTKEITVAELAAVVEISAARFSERFKRETGFSPADFVRRARCKAACVMIKENKLSITEIAYRLKFAGSQHFAGVFKKYMGMSPSEYFRGQSLS
jgi:AraC-like DNA-binding protein